MAAASAPAPTAQPERDCGANKMMLYMIGFVFGFSWDSCVFGLYIIVCII